MALLNPIYGLILPFLFICTLPLAFFATLTTLFAFCVLLFRVALIYIELALAVIPYYLGPRIVTAIKPASAKVEPIIIPAKRRKRRSSSSSALSAGSITPVAMESNSILGTRQSIGVARDFEGVGGWRLGDAEEEEEAWTNINSRLVLPADHTRRHQRSHTSGGLPISARNSSPEAVMMMNSSRVRAKTPDKPKGGWIWEPDGYFPADGISRAGASSSGSSKGSSVLSMKQR
jgi:hypothetical protein